jgi:hypothetical protein
MSHYIRVELSFWTNRKTLRLRQIIGEAAFWVPPRLWSYAAENQPNGNFSDYSDAEIALLLGYQADEKTLIDALHSCGFMRDRKIHDWLEHNGFIQIFSKRARTAANARWSKHTLLKEKSRLVLKEKKQKKDNTRQDNTRQEQALLKQCPSNAQALLGASRATLSEITTYAASEAINNSDAEWFYYKCEGNGWTVNGRSIKNWRMTLKAWQRAGYLPSQRSPKAKPTERESKLEKEMREARERTDRK